MIPNWIRDVLPAPFFTYGPKGLMWWQWLGLLALILISLALGRALGEVTRRILLRITRRTSGTWDDRLFARISGGIGLLWALAVFRTLQAFAAIPGIEALTAGGRFPLRIALRSSIMPGYEIRSEVTAIGPAATDPSMFTVPAGYQKILPPVGGG